MNGIVWRMEVTMMGECSPRYTEINTDLWIIAMEGGMIFSKWTTEIFQSYIQMFLALDFVGEKKLWVQSLNACSKKTVLVAHPGAYSPAHVDWRKNRLSFLSLNVEVPSIMQHLILQLGCGVLGPCMEIDSIIEIKKAHKHDYMLDPWIVQPFMPL